MILFSKYLWGESQIISITGSRFLVIASVGVFYKSPKIFMIPLSNCFDFFLMLIASSLSLQTEICNSSGLWCFYSLFPPALWPWFQSPWFGSVFLQVHFLGCWSYSKQVSLCSVISTRFYDLSDSSGPKTFWIFQAFSSFITEVILSFFDHLSDVIVRLKTSFSFAVTLGCVVCFKQRIV